MKPSFPELIHLRKEWKIFHQAQDRKNADRVFQLAGVGLITDADLKFLPHLLRVKLNEFGRDWERPIAATALRAGYLFYRAELMVSVDQVNALHEWIENSLSEKIDPDNLKGATLFFESNGLHSVKNGAWDSLFYFVLHPSLKPESMGLEDAPSIQGTPTFLRIA